MTDHERALAWKSHIEGMASTLLADALRLGGHSELAKAMTIKAQMDLRSAIIQAESAIRVMHQIMGEQNVRVEKAA
jgi:hypothetical protein